MIELFLFYKKIKLYNPLGEIKLIDFECFITLQKKLLILLRFPGKFEYLLLLLPNVKLQFCCKPQPYEPNHAKKPKR